MTLREETIVTSDGVPLGATVYGSGAHDLIVIASAMGVRRRYYHAFASFCALRGFGVVTFDYRGIGGSRRGALRKEPARLDDWGRHDLDAVLSWGAQHSGARRLHLVAHSVGGQIAGLASSLAEVERIVLVAAQSGYWRHWSGIRRSGLHLFWLAMPIITGVFGEIPGWMLGGDPVPPGVARQWAQWGRTPRYVWGHGDELDLTHYTLFDRPMLVWSFGDDHYAPPASVNAIVREYANAKVSRHPVERGIGHFGFFREPVGGRFWEETASFLK